MERGGKEGVRGVLWVRQVREDERMRGEHSVDEKLWLYRSEGRGKKMYDSKAPGEGTLNIFDPPRVLCIS